MTGPALLLPERTPRPPLVLREWGEPGYAYELRRVRLLYARLAVAHDQSGPQVDRILDLIESSEQGALWLAGFGGGFVSGIQERLAAWLEDIARMLQTLLKQLARAADGAAALPKLSVEEFLRRPMLEAAPTGLSPTSSELMQSLIDLHGLGPHIELLRTVDSAATAIGFARMIELAPEALAGAVASAGAAWFRDLIEDPSFESQGWRIGHPVGAGAVELIRALAEPPLLDVAQLITLLDLGPDEQAALGLADRR
ncbi:MAG: hypothetical protein ING41_13450 [Burkholderiales bacterium]|nr:hypothetical protein [Burkholderiales bacterium]